MPKEIELTIVQVFTAILLVASIRSTYLNYHSISIIELLGTRLEVPSFPLYLAVTTAIFYFWLSLHFIKYIFPILLLNYFAFSILFAPSLDIFSLLTSLLLFSVPILLSGYVGLRLGYSIFFRLKMTLLISRIKRDAVKQAIVKGIVRTVNEAVDEITPEELRQIVIEGIKKSEPILTKLAHELRSIADEEFYKFAAEKLRGMRLIRPVITEEVELLCTRHAILRSLQRVRDVDALKLSLRRGALMYSALYEDKRRTYFITANEKVVISSIPVTRNRYDAITVLTPPYPQKFEESVLHPARAKAKIVRVNLISSLN